MQVGEAIHLFLDVMAQPLPGILSQYLAEKQVD